MDGKWNHMVNSFPAPHNQSRSGSQNCWTWIDGFYGFEGNTIDVTNCIIKEFAICNLRRKETSSEKTNRCPLKDVKGEKAQKTL